MNEVCLTNLFVEALDLFLLVLRKYLSGDSTVKFIRNEELERFLDLLPKDCRITQNHFQT